MVTKFDVLERGQSTLYGACGGIWVMILHAKPTTPEMLLARPALTAMARREPRGFPTLTWVTMSAGLSMDAEARKAATDVTNDFTKLILAQSTVIEGEGFQAATVRAIVTGMDAVTRSACPKKTFATGAAAVDWCLARIPAGASPAPATEVALAVESARSALTPSPRTS